MKNNKTAALSRRVALSRQVGALLVFGLLTLPSSAQPSGTLVLDTNAPEAEVLANGTRLGLAMASPFEVPADTLYIELRGDERGTWGASFETDTVVVDPGDTLHHTLNLPYSYRIETIPTGASLLIATVKGDSVLGTTPLLIKRSVPLEDTLVARTWGFFEARVLPGKALQNRHTLMLRPLEDRAHAEFQGNWRPSRREPALWIDLAAASLALAAAGVAIHYKFEADAIDDRYRSPNSPERGDPRLKREAEHLDRYALAGLGAMQVGLGIVAVRFLLR